MLKTKCALLLFLSFALFYQALAQRQNLAWYYCIDTAGKTVYHAYGKATVKPKLGHVDHYQYGFMKKQGWINRNWKELKYSLSFITAKNRKEIDLRREALLRDYRAKNFKLKEVSMPYPMAPFSNYRKDGTNGRN